MQRHSTIAQIIALVAVPLMSACTVTVVEDDTDDTQMDAAADDEPTGSDSDGGASETDDATETSADPDGGTSGEDDPSATDDEAEDGGAPAQPVLDSGSEAPADAGDEPTESDASSPEGDAGDEQPSEGDGGGAVGGTVKTGYIALSQTSLTVLEQQIITSAAGAGFSVATYEDAPSDPVELPCETETSGLCVLQVCDISDSTSDPGPTVTSTAVSAGDITVSGLSQSMPVDYAESGRLEQLHAGHCSNGVLGRRRNRRRERRWHRRRARIRAGVDRAERCHPGRARVEPDRRDGDQPWRRSARRLVRRRRRHVDNRRGRLERRRCVSSDHLHGPGRGR
jgi:hypothetical protein